MLMSNNTPTGGVRLGPELKKDVARAMKSHRTNWSDYVRGLCLIDIAAHLGVEIYVKYADQIPGWMRREEAERKRNP